MCIANKRIFQLSNLRAPIVRSSFLIWTDNASSFKLILTIPSALEYLLNEDNDLHNYKTVKEYAQHKII